MRTYSILALIVLFVACGKKSDDHHYAGITSLAPPATSHSQAVIGTSSHRSKSITGGDTTRPASAQAGPTMIIRDGSLTLVTSDQPTAVQRITSIVTASGGFVSEQASATYESGLSTSNLTVRIPAVRFDTVLVEIKKVGSSVASEHITAEDVTEHYSDDEAHLAAQRAEMEQLIALLHSATKIDDIIAIKKEMADVQETIDELTTGTKGVERQVSYSTLHVELTTIGAESFASKIAEGFRRGFSSFADVLSGTISFLIGGIPAFIGLLLLVWLGVVVLRKMLKSGKSG